MSEKIYFDADTAYDSGTLYDWYLASVDNSLPVWTELHIDELFNDFYVIPKDTKPADVAPVVHSKWVGAPGYWHCPECGAEPLEISPYCPGCGAIMDEE